MDPLSSTLPPGDVFAGLRAESIETRDSATRMAIAMGTAVARKLLLWEEAPLSNRARRLWAYTGVHLRRAEELLARPSTFALEHAGTLASTLEALGARHGVLVARDLPEDVERSVKLAMESTTLLGALDEACLQAGCRGVQRARGELAATAGADPRYPASYHGPSRVRAVEVRSVRTTDFATTTATTQVRLRADWEWPITPLSSVIVELEDGRSFEATPVGTVVNVGIVAELAVEVPAAPELALAGRVSALFDGPFAEIRVPVPGTVEIHGLSATASIAGDGCQLVLETKDPTRTRGDVSAMGVSPMILAIAADGEEGVPQVHRVRTAGAPGSERWALRNRDGFGAVIELRLRVAAPPIRAAFPFALPPIAMP